MTHILLPTLVVGLAVSLFPGAPRDLGTEASPVSSTMTAPPPSALRVAAGNVREGTLVRPLADHRDGTDRRAFARRLLGRPGGLPDVVLLQESLGSASRVAGALSAHRRAQRAGVRYRLLTGTDLRRVSGRCDGARAGRFVLLRSSAILVNSRTVMRVLAQGRVRTWGRWGREVWHVTGRDGFGCTEHPWARVRVRHPGTTARTALVSSLHVAPVGRARHRAVTVVHRAADRLHRRTPQDLVVLGGDLNLIRCRVAPSSPEPARCTLQAGHRSLRDAGYADAVRQRHLRGPSGVVGVSRRVDFLMVKGAVTAAWFDRCYRAYRVHRWTCGARAVFAHHPAFDRCQRRSLHRGSAGPGCPPRRYRTYYSDHPVLTTTVR